MYNMSDLKFAGPLAKVRPLGYLEVGHRVGIVGVGSDGVTPPFELDVVVGECEEDYDGCDGGSGVHGGLEEI